MPDDPTPLGDAMTHRFTDQKIPEPEPGRARADDANAELDISKRPALPEHPEPMAADEMKDEDARHGADRGPGSGDGMKSLDKQRG